jgi:hypothetical protein
VKFTSLAQARVTSRSWPKTHPSARRTPRASPARWSHAGVASPGRRGHSTLPLTVIDRHSLEIYIRSIVVILLSLLDIVFCHNDSVAHRSVAPRSSRSSPGRHCHSTLALGAIDRHSLGIYTVILLTFLDIAGHFCKNDGAARATVGSTRPRSSAASSGAAGRGRRHHSLPLASASCRQLALPTHLATHTASILHISTSCAREHGGFNV